MAIILRFVDGYGYVRERFLDLVHVKDTTSMTLKEEILECLSSHNLSVENIRGQGYDGASNMRGEWNGLQALILQECPYGYYVHCLAHQLQLALVAASREVHELHLFFQNLNFIINVIVSSSKHNNELRDEQVAEIARLLEIGELETGSGLNQIGTLQRASDTRWSSHFKSVSSLMKLFGPSCVVLKSISQEKKYDIRGNGKSALKLLRSFEFVFILHVMKELMGITDILCKAFQHKSQDILNALNLVTSTKRLLQNLRDEGWGALLADVHIFCERYDVKVPDLSVLYSDVIGSCQKKDKVTVEHHYRVDVFIATIDQQLEELNYRFGEKATELLMLSASLDPKDSFNSFDIDAICTLAEKFYPADFSENEKIVLRYQLQHYQIDVLRHHEFQDLTIISELCQVLARTGKSEIFYLVDRLVRLVLTLPVSTATTERAFSAMKIVKTRLRNEKEIAEYIQSDTIIDDFAKMKNRRVELLLN